MYKRQIQLLLLLNTKNTDQLEWVFTCLAYLFKFLWRFLIRDLTSVFESLLPLLSNSKPRYINNFAAESFAFIARKVKDRRNFIKLILRSLQKNNEVSTNSFINIFATMSWIRDMAHASVVLMSCICDIHSTHCNVFVQSEHVTCVQCFTAAKPQKCNTQNTPKIIIIYHKISQNTYYYLRLSTHYNILLKYP